jgi:signal transduction histidine kinase
MSSSRKLGNRIFFRARGYVIAIVFVAIATWLKYLAQPDIIPSNVPILYILAIVPTAIFFGFGPSILVCFLSIFAFDFFFNPPLYQINLFNAQSGTFLALFFIVGLAISYLASSLRQKKDLALREIAARKQSEAELEKYKDHLEEMVQQRTNELEIANKELESFSYSVSHDLRAPLRSIDGFSQAILEDYADKLDEQGKDYLKRIRESSQMMAQIIDDILGLSRVVRAELDLKAVNLTDIAREISLELKRIEPERQVEFNIMDGVEAIGDANLLRSVIQNLLSNAFKFTAKCQVGRINFGVEPKNGKNVYYVRDNGVGFDMKYADKLFMPFERLHPASEFAGTGIGLATVQRIVRRHGGKVWAEGEAGKGASFNFTLDQ